MPYNFVIRKIKVIRKPKAKSMKILSPDKAIFQKRTVVCIIPETKT